MKKEFSKGDKVKFLPPKKRQQKVRTVGTGIGSGCDVKVDGTSAFLKYNQVYQVSDSKKVAIVSASARPLPLISVEFLRKSKLKSRFKLIESKKKEKSDE